MIDLGPPAQQVAMLLAGVDDARLMDPTPCEAYAVGDLLDHLMGLTLAFRHTAAKTSFPPASKDAPSATSGRGVPSADHLDPEWRSRLPRQLDELVAAWQDPAAWQGTAQAGGVTLPAEVMGAVALDELVLHGWDLAKGTGQPFGCDPASTQVCFAFTSQSAQPEQAAAREGVFGPVVEVPADAPLLDRALGFSGRDPSWRP